MLTFVATLGLGQDWGFLTGFVIATLVLLLRTQTVKKSFLGRFEESDTLQDLAIYKDVCHNTRNQCFRELYEFIMKQYFNYESIESVFG